MEIKENKTRISLWIKGKRFSKIESNKLIITKGYSNKNRNLWIIFNFTDVNNCLDLLQSYILENYKISLNDRNHIQKIYQKLYQKILSK